ncbi:hypothetical protein K5E37_23160 [Pseudomonas sp. RIT778]|jgi:hypothetical protein|uniref:hypothetical protein n=1 Tax=Pseudomonas sp. RIT778 TaxID=2870471 RepID=UPI001C885905|nr:hypothetical protein [Pseudomonas sp. RIT778]MBX8471944.1 hypothetical protein [Pseudomonas sp. RIT778]
MSDQDESKYEEELKEFFENKVNVSDWWKGRDLDWVLQDLVWSVDVNNDEYTPNISITTAAGVIAGKLISRNTYISELANQMFGEESLKIKDDWLQKATPKPGAENHPPQFIHIKDAQVFTGNARIPNDTGVLWRGKLSAVIGFSYSGLE